MSALVLDASVAAKWFTEEEHTTEALALLASEEVFHVPDFFFLEMDNVVCKWIRRGVLTLEDAVSVRASLRQASMKRYPFSSLQDSAYELAAQNGRSVYDCLYVALAVALKGRMVTADRRLYEAFADGPLRRYVGWVGEG